MPEKTIGRPRTGSKARELFQGEAIPSGQDSRRCARKLKAQIHSNRRPIYLRLYAWLSGSAPAALRIWLSSIPSLPALVLAYCLFSVLLFSGHVSSTFFVQISTSVTRARGQSMYTYLTLSRIRALAHDLHAGRNVFVGQAFVRTHCFQSLLVTSPTPSARSRRLIYWNRQFGCRGLCLDYRGRVGDGDCMGNQVDRYSLFRSPILCMLYTRTS